MTITLIGKPECHLCDEARAVIEAVAAETGQVWQELSILEDTALADEYWDRIPVIKVDDDIVGIGRITADQLRSALC